MKPTPRTGRAPWATAASALLLALAAACGGAGTAPDGSAARNSGAAPSGGAAAASGASPTSAQSAADASLAAEVERAIAEGGIESARWGVFVLSLRDGRTLYARDATLLFTPASVMKVYTTAVALDELGAGYRWRTSVYASAAPDRAGTVSGDLVLYGRGAPDLTSRPGRDGPSQLAALADELYRRGVRRVRGDVVGDESFFRGERQGDGWLWEDLQWYYGAEPSALTLDGNEVTLSLAPGPREGDPVEFKLVPPTDHLSVTNDARTSAPGTRAKLGVTRSLSANDVRVWGELPAGAAAYGVRLSVREPALRAARLFREALRERDIEVTGRARAVDARTPEEARLDVSGAVELAQVESRTLGEVVRETNKESLNLQAELILRTLGRERGAPPPERDPRRTREPDADEAGLTVVRRWLEAAGVTTEALALHDGSGLSRLNLVTPEATARLLARIAQTPSAEIFRASLPVAGRDGTLQSRMRSDASAEPVVAKTGTLTYVNALAGYASTVEGEPLAFAIFCNDKTETQTSLRVIDQIALALTRYPHSQETPRR